MSISNEAQQAVDAEADEVLFSHATLERAFRHLRDVLSLAIQYTPDQAALVVHDSACPLAEVLTSAYR